MSARRPTINKGIYIAAIAVLLFPLYAISKPASDTSAGGTLAQMRMENDLSQASLGEIDPTSETIRLATLGLRGVAVQVLWHKANEYKRVEDWANFMAAVEQITKLQPNFYKVWDYQSHNVTYNTSVEFDDYHDRYRWVMKGIDFMSRGVRLNQKDPRFAHRLGWTIGQKIGRADERVQFRRLFREDDDFHGPRLREDRDNWLVGREWFEIAEGKVRDPSLIRGTSPLLFYSEAPKSLINYAEALETDGRFGDFTRNAWERGTREYLLFGARDLPTSFGVDIRLLDKEELEARVEELTAEIESLAPGVRERLESERREELSDEEREALEVPAAQRTSDQYALARQAEQKVTVTDRELANETPTESREQALALAARIDDLRERINIISRYREIANFEYWRDRSRAGTTENWQEAQRYAYEAREDFAATRFADAIEAYEKSFQYWAKVFKEFPSVVNEGVASDDLMREIISYAKVLDQQEMNFPSRFVLDNFLEGVAERDPGNEYLQMLTVARARAGQQDEEAEDSEAGESDDEAAMSDEGAETTDAEMLEGEPAGETTTDDPSSETSAGVEAEMADEATEATDEASPAGEATDEPAVETTAEEAAVE